MRDEQASATAMLVARGVAFQSRQPQNAGLVPDAATWQRIAGPTPPPWRVALMERLTVPGISLHYVLRKREIERQVRAAIRDGFRPVVILGAGFDTLGMRLREEIRVIEVDHPATQRKKREIAPSIEYVSVDLVRHGVPYGGIVVAEAVFLYLSEAEVRKVLRSLVRPVRLIFTFMEPRAWRAINFQNATWIADLWLRWKSEPMRWSIAPHDLAAFLASEGFELRELRLDHEYHGEFGPLARGEHLAVAEAKKSA